MFAMNLNRFLNPPLRQKETRRMEMTMRMNVRTVKQNRTTDIDKLKEPFRDEATLILA